MAILLLREKPTEKQISQISGEFKDYIKVVVDLKKEVIAAGGKLHADCEGLLLETGSRQENLWGGGVDRISKRIDYSALTNIRPH